MKITLGDVRQTVRDVLAEAGARLPKPAAYVGDDFLLSDPDGTQYRGGRNGIRRALVQHSSADAAERNDVMNTGHASVAIINALKRAGVIKRIIYKPEKSTSHARSGASRSTLERAYRKAVDEFAAQWTDFTDENPDSMPEDAASDAADSFFWEHEREWPAWAKALGMTRQTMKEVVTNYVYDAMMKGAKNLGHANEGKMHAQTTAHETSSHASHRSQIVEHGDQCPECGGTIITKHGQFEHLKCRDCGYVPSKNDVA